MATNNALNNTLSGQTGTGSAVGSISPSLITPALGTPTAIVLTNGTGLPITTGISGLGTSISTFLSTPTSANLASAITDETGSGSLVFATSPTLVTPILGTPTSVTLTNATGLPISTGVSGLAANVATFLSTPSSANLASALTDETGSGASVFSTSPTLVTPILGTPTSGTLTNCTGLPISTGVSGLATGIATFLATPTSANLISAVTNETGTGSLVFSTSPTLVTPILGAATGTSLSFSSTSGIIGTNTNDSAASGSVGECTQTLLLVGSALSLVSGTAKSIISIPFTAGDWDISGELYLGGGATTVLTNASAAVNLTLNTINFNTPSTSEAQNIWIGGSGASATTVGFPVFPVGPTRMSFSTTTTVYLNAFATFTVSTCVAYGKLMGRRVR